MIPAAKPERVAATCTVELTSPVVDAGTDLTLRVLASCEPPCDLESEAVEIRDQDGAVVTDAALGAYDTEAKANGTGLLRLRAPVAPGEYAWSARLPSFAGEEVVYDEVIVPVAFTVRAHLTSALVWDVPAAVVVGEPFRIKVGIKCSGQCRLAHRRFTVHDETGETIVASAVGPEVWPKSAALHFAELELRAPPEEGKVRWEIRCAEEDLLADGAETPLAHGAASAGFELRCVPHPEFSVRVEAWDAERQMPLAGARVLLHPFGAVTDEHGVAEVRVVGGRYRLFVSQTKYTTFGAPLEVAGDLSTRIELSLEPPPARE